MFTNYEGAMYNHFKMFPQQTRVNQHRRMISKRNIYSSVIFLFALITTIKSIEVQISSPTDINYQLDLVTQQDQANLIIGVPFNVFVNSAEDEDTIPIDLLFSGYSPAVNELHTKRKSPFVRGYNW